eukprot:1341678-Lingulodinium_polyedra.AAC.1
MALHGNTRSVWYSVALNGITRHAVAWLGNAWHCVALSLRYTKANLFPSMPPTGAKQFLCWLAWRVEAHDWVQTANQDVDHA